MWDDKLKTVWEIRNEISHINSEKFYKGEEVHVWYVCLKSDYQFGDIFSLEEKERASRFRLIRDKNRYLTAHGLSRLILSGYLEVEPEKLIFKKSKYGKPYLFTNERDNRMEFNMTHSGNTCCLILSKQHEVGIDIELKEQKLDWINIAKNYFSTSEINYLEGLPITEQSAAFLSIWTRKEALLKLMGKGLQHIEKLTDDYYKNMMNSNLVPFSFRDMFLGSAAINSNKAFPRFFHLVN